MAMRKYVNYYESLGIDSRASYREIKDAYYKKIVEFYNYVIHNNIDLLDYENIHNVNRAFYYFSDMERRFMNDIIVKEISVSANLSVADRMSLYGDLYVLDNDYSLEEDQKLVDNLIGIYNCSIDLGIVNTNKDLLHVFGAILVNCKILRKQILEKKGNVLKK